MSAAPAQAAEAPLVPPGLARFTTWLRYGPAVAAAGLAAGRLGLLGELARSPRQAAGLAAGHGLSERATRIVLESLLAARVLRSAGAGGFLLAREVPCLIGGAAPLAALLERVRSDWLALGTLEAPLRGDGPDRPLATAAALLGAGPAPADLAEHLAHPPCRWLLHALLDGAVRQSALAAARRLGVLEPLLAGEGDPEALRAAARLGPPAFDLLRRMLRAAGVLEPGAGPLALTAAAARVLQGPGRVNYLQRLALEDDYWRAYGRLDETLRTDRPVMGLDEPDRGGSFYAGLARANVAVLAGYLAAARGAARLFAGWAPPAPRVVDVGTGSGVWAAGFALQFPDARVTLVDWAPVLAAAEPLHRRLGLGDARRVPADVRDLSLPPGGSDLVLMGQLCHALDRRALPALLAEAGRGLAPGGALLIADQVLNRGRTGPPERLLFGLKLLVGTRGEVLSAAEYAALLRAAGFTAAVLVDRPSLDLGLIAATRDRPPPGVPDGRDSAWRSRRLLG